MRATRAYLAGFGTSGSLLVGAAAMFILASAIVAFHGWPGVRSQTPVARVSVPQINLASGASRAGRILQAALAGRAGAGAGAAGARSGGLGAAGGPRGTTGAGPQQGSQVGSLPVAAVSGPNATGHPSVPCATPACVTGVSPSVPVNGVSDSLGKTVSNAGAQTGSAISGATGSAGNTVSTVSPSAGSTVQNTGSSAGSTVTTTADTVGQAISGGGHAVSGLTGH